MSNGGPASISSATPAPAPVYKQRSTLQCATAGNSPKVDSEMMPDHALRWSSIRAGRGVDHGQLSVHSVALSRCDAFRSKPW